MVISLLMTRIISIFLIKFNCFLKIFEKLLCSKFMDFYELMKLIKS